MATPFPDPARVAATVVQEALTHADSKPDASRDFGWHLIHGLHEAFKRQFDGTGYKIFSKSTNSKFQRGDGKPAHEFLYDVSVVECGPNINSPGHRKLLPTLGRPVWQVESENHTSTRAVLFDLSKLVQGAAQNKLLITRERRIGSIKCLAPTATLCTGRIFLAHIPSYDRSGRKAQGRYVAERGLWEFKNGVAHPLVGSFS